MELINQKINSVKYRLYGHEENLRWCEKWNRILGILHIMVSSSIAALSLSGILKEGESIPVANFIMGVALAGITSVMNFLKFPNQMDSHRQAIQRYSQLLEDLELFMVTTPTSKDSDSQIHELIREIVKRYHHIKTSSPLIREKIYKEKRKKFVDLVREITDIV